jgi:hypothetical protein
MTDPLSVHAALVEVMRDVTHVGKDGFNQSQNFKFRGVDATVMAVGPALRRHGVLMLPRVLSSTYREYATSKGTAMHECVLEVEFTFVGPDGSVLVCSVMGESADSGDKATAKAHSVAWRTAMLVAFAIPTDEPDPDETSIERGPEEIIPVAEAKTRLLNASTEDIAKQVWAGRDEPIGVLALNALIDVAAGMKKHQDRKAGEQT